VAQSIKCPTLDFCSGHDLRVVGLSLASGSVVGNLLEILSLPLPPLPKKERKKGWTQMSKGGNLKFLSRKHDQIPWKLTEFHSLMGS